MTRNTQLRTAFCFLIGMLLALGLAARWAAAADPAPPSVPSAGLRPELALQMGHTDHIIAIAYSPDSRWVATAAADHMVKLWDARTHELRWTIKTGDIGSVAFSPDSRRLATSEWYSNVWDVETGKLVHREYGSTNGISQDITFVGNPEKVAFTNSGRLAFCPVSAAGGRSGWMPVHDSSRPEVQITGMSYLSGINRYAVATAHQVVLYTGPGSDAEGKEAYFFCVDITQARLFHRGCVPICGDAIPTQEQVVRAAFSPGGLVAIADRKGQIGIWHATPGTYLGRLVADGGKVTTLAWSPDGRYLAHNGGPQGSEVVVREYHSRRVLWRREFPSGRIDALTFSPDSGTLAVGKRNGRAELFTTAEGKTRGELSGIWGGEPALAVSPKGDWAATVSGVDTARVDLWNLKTGELARTWEAFGQAAFCTAAAPGNNRLAVGGGNSEQAHGALQVFSPATGARLWNGGDQPGAVRSTCFSPDGRWLASGSYRRLRIWKADTGCLAREIDAHGHVVTGIAWSPSGHLLATASADRTIKLWNTADWSLHRVLKGHADWITAVSFSPDGKELTSSSWDATVRRWNLASGESTVLPGPKHWLLSLAYSPDGHSLAVSASDGSVTLWDLSTSIARVTFPAHPQDTYAVHFTPDGRKLMTISPETALSLWSPLNGRWLVSLLALHTPPEENPSRPIRAESRIISGSARNAEPGLPLPPAGEPTEEPPYLAMLPGGFYCGSLRADRMIRFRFGDALYSPDCFYTPFYQPALLPIALEGEALPAPPLLRGTAVPAIRFLSSPRDTRIEHGVLRLGLEAMDDSRVSTVIVLAGGSRFEAVPAAEEEAGEHRLGDRRRFGVTIPISGKNGALAIRAVAYDDDNLRSAPATTQIRLAPGRGRLLSLCVGISRYLDPRLRLRFAAADARDLGAALGQQASGKSALYAAAPPTILTDENATRKKVLETLDALALQAQPNDTVVLFLAGHGWEAGPSQFYFATQETLQTDLRGTALAWDEVAQRVQRLAARSRRVLVLLDACHSGSASTKRRLERELDAQEGGLVVISGSRDNEVSLESPNLGHGQFTYALLEALRPPLRGPALPLLELVERIRKRVAVLSKERQHPQLAYHRDFDNDAPLFRVSR